MQKSEYLNLWVDLIHTNDAISKVRQKELKPFDVTPEQTGILFCLTLVAKNPTPADLSRMLIKDRSSITLMLNRMETKGLISKRVDDKNKNLVRVSITEKGRKIYIQIIDKFSIYRIFSGLTDEQCQQLQTYLKLLQARASEELKNFG